MNEYRSLLTFIGLLALFAAVTLLLGRQERKRTRAKLRRSLRDSFGKPSAKRITPERYAQIPQYWKHHAHAFEIDDITWEDLDMDHLYRRMDTTCSASGEEYLYHLLRSPALTSRSLPFREEQYAWFSGGAHEEERLRLQEILTGLGRAGRYSLYDYIDFTEALGERSNTAHYIAAALPFAAFALMFWNTGIGLIALLAVFAFNLRTYFRIKAEIAPHFQVFSYILRLLDCAGELREAGCPVFSEETAQIPSLLQAFSSFRRGSSLLLGSAGGGSDPFSLILEYVRILFHLDLIKFNSMLGQMRGKREQIDALITITGRIDACISIASWRDSLPYCCVPALTEGSAAFRAQELYHPLLAGPVGNDIAACRPVLVTGSNASGKSTFLKAAALCALLSQAVGIAPARQYDGAFYRIYTSMALRDSLQDGESYFIVEIKSLQRILKASEKRPADSKEHADARDACGVETDPQAPVLCCIDEVLRGTNTVERIAASTEILRCFSQSGTLCFAATHDLELTTLLAGDFDNMHFSEEIVDGDVRFSYRLLPGPSDSCNAIALLDELGYDSAIVERARRRADAFLTEGTWSAR